MGLITSPATFLSAGGYTPDVRIENDGTDITGNLRPYLLNLTIRDEAGRESDKLDLTLDDSSELPLPADGSKLEVWLGYKEDEGDLPFMGAFTVDDILSAGSDGSGQTLKISGKSADMRDTLKERDYRHYDNMTLGQMFAKEAAEHGLQAYVSPELADINPGYLIRDNVSLLHFGEQLSKTHDAAFKVAGGRMLFVKRQNNKSLSGLELPTIEVTRPGNLLSWSVKPRIGRPSYGSARVDWWDQQQARRVTETSGAGDGPVHTDRHLRRNKQEAQAAARSRKNQLDRNKAGGSVTIRGTPTAMAESKVEISGIRDGVDGWWFGKSVSHTLAADFKTTIQIEPKLAT